MYLLDASQALFGSRDFAGKESKIVLECFKMAYHLSLIFVFRLFFLLALKCFNIRLVALIRVIHP